MGSTDQITRRRHMRRRQVVARADPRERVALVGACDGEDDEPGLRDRGKGEGQPGVRMGGVARVGRPRAALLARAGDPGKSDAVWPSGPSPRCTSAIGTVSADRARRTRPRPRRWCRRSRASSGSSGGRRGRASARAGHALVRVGIVDRHATARRRRRRRPSPSRRRRRGAARSSRAAVPPPDSAIDAGDSARRDPRRPVRRRRRPGARRVHQRLRYYGTWTRHRGGVRGESGRSGAIAGPARFLDRAAHAGGARSRRTRWSPTSGAAPASIFRTCRVRPWRSTPPSPWSSWRARSHPTQPASRRISSRCRCAAARSAAPGLGRATCTSPRDRLPWALMELHHALAVGAPVAPDDDPR